MWSIVLIVLVSLVYLAIHNGRPLYYPPGPRSLPIIGNIHQVWSKLRKLKYHHKVWAHWLHEYGNIVGLQLGGVNVVIVTGKENIKEVCAREEFDGRPDGFVYTMRSFGKKYGLVFADGPSWQNTRRIALTHLRYFGYKSSRMEDMIFNECIELNHYLTRVCNEPVSINNLFDVSVVNVLWRLVAGKRYDLEDDRLKALCVNIRRAFKVVDMSGGLLTYMPALRHIAPGLVGYTEITEIHDTMYEFLREVLTEHKRTIDVHAPRDVLDCLIIEMFDYKISEEELLVICLDFLEAGMETVSNSLVFMLLYIALNDGVQKKIHKEINTFIGTATSAGVLRKSMVYCEAVILEALRLSSVPAVGIPHMALQTAKLGHYVIPKGTFILLALHELHNGPHWKDAHAFKPERYITKDGNLLQDESLMFFGEGRRRCIGENLARLELFMFLTSILQNFELELVKDQPPPSTEPINGISLTAQPFQLMFRPRNIESKYYCTP